MSRRATAAVLAGIVIVAAAWFNYVVAVDAYGSGPPYFGRTENMDKWTDPVPDLVMANLAALALLALLVWFAKRRSPPVRDPQLR